MKFYVSVFVFICKGGYGGIFNIDRYRFEWVRDYLELG